MLANKHDKDNITSFWIFNNFVKHKRHQQALGECNAQGSVSLDSAFAHLPNLV